VRHPAYWDQTRQPNLDGVQMTYFEGEQPQILALQGGQVDLVTEISFQGGRSLFTNGGVQIFPTRAATHREVHMRVDKDPFRDKRVRQAIALTLDRKAIIQGLFAGRADIGNDSPFWSGFPSTDPSVPQRTQDLTKAKALMAAAGVRGFDVTLTTERVFEIPDLCVLIQQAVKPIGGAIKLNLETPTQYFGTGKPGQTPWLEVTMGIVDYGHRPTPNVFLGAPLQTGGIWNAAHFSDPTYDALVKRYTAEVDVQRQQAIAGKIQTLLLDETPLLIPYFYNYLSAGSKRLQGYKADAQGLLDLRSASLA
jgi:peptide/nickel transport system substrate-binding protein